jgi:hypothetical protein
MMMRFAFWFSSTACPEIQPLGGMMRRRSECLLANREVGVPPAAVIDIHRRSANIVAPGAMKVLIVFVGWCILFVLCWPVAVLALILLPVVWLISLPLRLIGITIEAAFALIRALLFLPARLLGLRAR